MLKVLHRLVFFTWLIALTGAASANELSKLQAVAQRFIDDGYYISALDHLTSLAQKQTASLGIELKKDTSYLFVAICSEHCAHVELGFLDGKRTEIARTPEKSDAVALAGEPPADGEYILTIEPQSCTNQTCAVAYAILARAPPPVQPPGRAPNTETLTGLSTAPPPPPPPAQDQGAADQIADAIVEQIKSLILSKIEIEQALKVDPPALMPPIVSDAETAPGKPKGFEPPTDSAPVRQPAAPQSPSKTSAQKGGAACAQAEQRYYAAARTAGDPASISQVVQLYAYLQCNCGFPPSPHVAGCR